MRLRLTPPSLPVFLISFVLAAVTLATFWVKVPYVGHFVSTHRLGTMIAAYLILLLGIVIEGL
jgi:hypothetical protein